MNLGVFFSGVMEVIDCTWEVKEKTEDYPEILV